jgi:hypothetical protein
MGLFNRFAPFCFAVLLTSLLGCASTPKQEGTGEYFDDTVITTKVKAAVFSEPSLKSAEINVETFKGAVNRLVARWSPDHLARQSVGQHVSVKG